MVTQPRGLIGVRERRPPEPRPAASSTTRVFAEGMEIGSGAMTVVAASASPRLLTATSARPVPPCLHRGSDVGAPTFG